MAWPNFAPAPTPAIPNPPTADRMLDQIVSRTAGWLATLPEDPPGTPIIPPPAIPASARQRWQRIHDDALLCYVNSPAHHHHGDFIDAQGNAKPGESLDTPWEQVRKCRLKVYQAAPTMYDLELAIDYIDHLGNGGAPAAGLTLMPAGEIVTGRWSRYRPGADKNTAETILDAILSHAVGQLSTGRLSNALRASYHALVLAAFLDRSNVAHGYLRKYVKPDGTAAQANGLRTAWKHVEQAFGHLNGYTVSAADVRMARKLVEHRP